jgi:hypothetical protein
LWRITRSSWVVCHRCLVSQKKRRKGIYDTLSNWVSDRGGIASLITSSFHPSSLTLPPRLISIISPYGLAVDLTFLETYDINSFFSNVMSEVRRFLLRPYPHVRLLFLCMVRDIRQRLWRSL